MYSSGTLRPTTPASRKPSGFDVQSQLADDKNADSQIVKFFSQRSVFLTGATGFLGKAVLEKILRTCPKICNIYVLIRPTPNANVQMRLEKLLENSVFENICSTNDSILKKVIPISGDLLLPNLGISSDDQKLLENNVSVVINSAATIKFNEKLKTAFDINVNGVRSLISLCKQMKNLKALVHYSTAFANCDRYNIDEIIYPVNVDPDQLGESLSWMSDEVVNGISPVLVGAKPNTYSYTKGLAEHLLKSVADQLPICIVRPSVVGASWKEPVAGWVDNLNLPTSIFFGIGKGLLRVIKMDGTKCQDFVPVDFTVNVALVAAWKTASRKSNEMEVYNCCSRDQNPIDFGTVLKLIQKYTSENPMTSANGTPFICYNPNEFIYKVYDFLLQYLPSLIFDVILRIAQKQPHMMRAYGRISRSSAVTDFFLIRDWKFSTKNLQKLYSEMSAVDQKLFSFDMNELDWNEYFSNYCLGMRKYLCKENTKSIPAALRRQNKLYWIQFGVVLAALLIFVVITRTTMCCLA